jgi:hypothetical protein
MQFEFEYQTYSRGREEVALQSARCQRQALLPAQRAATLGRLTAPCICIQTYSKRTAHVCVQARGSSAAAP